MMMYINQTKMTRTMRLVEDLIRSEDLPRVEGAPLTGHVPRIGFNHTLHRLLAHGIGDIDMH